MPKHGQKHGPRLGNRNRGYSMKNSRRTILYAAAAAALLSACTPTIRIEVAPINIYAKLDADVRVRLDKEVQTAIQQNPNLF
jgi:hypothetical protein